MVKYKDLNLVGNVAVENRDAVMQKLKILLNSYKNSNFFFREYECDIRDILFAPFTLASSNKLEHRIRWCINSKIPELELISITMSPDYDKRVHGIKLNLSYDDEQFEFIEKIESKIK